MNTDNAQDMTAQERAALVAWWLAHGEAMTTVQVSELVGITPRSARRMMCRLARILPIYRNDDGLWEVCAMQEAD